MYRKEELLRFIEGLRRVFLGQGVKRIPIVRQATATDCGAAALAMVLKYWGRAVPLEELRERIGIRSRGATVTALLQAGRSYGLRARAVSTDIECLGSLARGAILFWEFRHYVVFEAFARGSVQLVDPARGHRTIPLSDFRRGFTGVALLFEPTEEFAPGSARNTSRAFAVSVKALWQQRGLLTRVLATSLCVQTISAIFPLLTGVLLDRVIPRHDYSLLLTLAVGYTGLQIFHAFIGFVRSYLLVYLRTQLEASFTLGFLNHLVSLPYSFFQQRTSGDIMVRLGGTNAIRTILMSTVFSTLLDGTTAAVYLIILLITNTSLAWLMVGLAILRLGLLMVVRRSQRRLLHQAAENQSRSQTAQLELLSGMETLKAMGLEHDAAEAWTNIFHAGLNISIKQGRLEAISGVFISLFGTCSNLCITFYGTYLVLSGTWSIGGMMAFGAIAGAFWGPLNNVVLSMLQLQTLEVYLERLNEVMAVPEEQNGDRMQLAAPLAGHITLERVSFRYSDQNALVVDDVSIHMDAGSRVAIAGRSGTGKSTLARLLTGLYIPTSGRILIDHNDLRTLDLQMLRRQLGVVTQDAQLFDGSIRRNIALCNPEMSLQEVVQAAKLACIHEEIIAMPMGYSTPLLDSGRSISGGQRQRIALARALAAKPKVLLLDEATSHLDAETEEKVMHNVFSLKCTTILIAHRLSTLQRADIVMVLDGGKIVQQGRHSDLAQRDGLYGELVRCQMGVHT